MLSSLLRWIDGHCDDVCRDDIVVIAHVGQDSSVLEAGQALACRGIEVRSTSANSLLDPRTIDAVRSSAARRAVLLAPLGCLTAATVGEFVAACQIHGKDVAFHTISDAEALFLDGNVLQTDGGGSDGTAIDELNGQLV